MDFIIFICVLICGFLFANNFKNKLNKKYFLYLKRLWVYHLVFGVYFCFFINGDAIGYWRVAKELTKEKFIFIILTEKGTAFMHAINYFPSNILNMSYFSNTILFTLLGYIGLTYFYVLTIKLIPQKIKFKGVELFPLLFFLPNLHFWSVAIGKDTVLFFCVGATFYSFYNKKYFFSFLSLIPAFLIRPHIIFFMVASYSFVFFFDKRTTALTKMFIVAVVIVLGVYMLPSVLEYAKIEEASLDSFSKFSSNKAELLSRAHTESSVDVSSLSWPLKIFTFLYRPFFFDINGIPAVLASFENLLLFFLSIKVLGNKPLIIYKSAPVIIKIMVIFLIIGTIAFSQTLGNVGIMLRMRNMFLPGMIIFILWSLSFNKKITKLTIKKNE